MPTPKVALITGGSRGVGRALALALAQRGYAISINHRHSVEQAESTMQELHKCAPAAICVQGDVADDHACRRIVDQTVAQLGQLDLLINNAATTKFVAHDQLDQISTALWDHIFAVNVRGPFQCVRAARPHLEASGEGQIINITSVAGITGNGSSIPYCASKAALINMTQALARALAPKIRVNSVAPGFIESQWTQDGLGDRYQEALEQTAARTPLGRVCKPEDVAQAVMTLVEGSSLVTGQTLVCDGGILLVK